MYKYWLNALRTRPAQCELVNWPALFDLNIVDWAVKLKQTKNRKQTTGFQLNILGPVGQN